MTVNANGSVLTLDLLRELLGKVDADSVVSIRMHPATAQAYEESGFSSVQWQPLTPGQTLLPEQGSSTCGKPIFTTLSQSEHFVDLVGSDGKNVGQISNLYLNADYLNPEQLLRWADRGWLSYKTVSRKLGAAASA